MQSRMARVTGGRLVLEDPSTDLPEGAEVELILVEDELTDEERSRLTQAIDESEADLDQHGGVDGFALITRLRERHAAAGR